MLKYIFLGCILYTELDNKEIFKNNHEYHEGMNYKYITI